MTALIRNHVRVIGQGNQTLVFAHGFGCDQTVWRSMLPYFENDYRIVLFDYVGSGRSDKTAYSPERYSSLHGYAQDVKEIAEELKLAGAVFIGHSVSGMIGLLTAIEAPQLFERLVLIGPSPRYLNDPPGYYGGFDDCDIRELLTMMEMNFVGWASMNAAALMDNPDRPKLSDELKSTFCAEDPEMMKNFAQTTFLSDHRADLPLVQVPSLIIQCSVDSIVPIEAARYLNGQLQDSVLQVIPSRGHYPHLSEPKATAELILRYLNGELPA